MYPVSKEGVGSHRQLLHRVVRYPVLWSPVL